MQNKITPFLWFKDNTEEAFQYYITVFGQGEIVNIMRYSKHGPGPEGEFMGGVLRVFDQEIFGLNGGTHFQFSPATSLFISCQTQEEIDQYWDGLAEGGQPMACGWLTDKFGVTWQIVPAALGKMLSDPDTEKSGRAAAAMMQMIKFDITTLEKAYLGE